MRLPIGKLTSRALVALACVTVLCGSGRVPMNASEAAIKAAFLAKFAAYVDWPAGRAPQAISLCVVGSGALRRLVDEAAAGQTLNGQPIIVRQMPRIDANSGCRVAYLGGSAAQSVEAAILSLRRAPVLTVTDAESGSTAGMIHFEVVERRVRFRIDQVQANAAGLTISSKLLALALSVHT